MEQNKKGRPKSENRMIRTAITLPRDLLDRLKANAAPSGRGLSSEIRYRLRLAFNAARPKTELLIELIRKLDRNLAIDGLWDQSESASEVFRLAVIHLIAELTEKGTEVGKDKLRSRYGAAFNPEMVARTLASAVLAQQATEFLEHEFSPDMK